MNKSFGQIKKREDKRVVIKLDKKTTKMVSFSY